MFRLVCIFFVAVISSAADLPTVGLVEYYGLRIVAKEAVSRLTTVRRGSPIPVSFSDSLTPAQLRKQFGTNVPANKAAIEAALEKIPGVVKSQITSVCCEPDGTATVFVGIQERDAEKFKYAPEPTSEAALPDEMMNTYSRYLEVLARAVRQGGAQEDDSQGHALIKNPEAEPLQNSFIEFATNNKLLLEKVLRTSASPKQRAAAATIMGYSDDKSWAAKHLSEAVRDSDGGVRNNATRSLAAILVLANRRPELGISLEPDIYIDMLGSLSWSDRNKATMLLQNLTQNRPPKVLKELRSRALPELIEMARWRDTHSQMALTLLGRIAGLTEPQIVEAWKSGGREEIIRQASNTD